MYHATINCLQDSCSMVSCCCVTELPWYAVGLQQAIKLWLKGNNVYCSGLADTRYQWASVDRRCSLQSSSGLSQCCHGDTESFAQHVPSNSCSSSHLQGQVTSVAVCPLIYLHRKNSWGQRTARIRRRLSTLRSAKCSMMTAAGQAKGQLPHIAEQLTLCYGPFVAVMHSMSAFGTSFATSVSSDALALIQHRYGCCMRAVGVQLKCYYGLSCSCQLRLTRTH